MRSRPNENQLIKLTASDTNHNDLYRSLMTTFEHLLRADDPDRQSLENDSYVRHPKMENAILEYCRGGVNSAAFLVGPTGIGKSTLLRHTLKVNRSCSFDKNTGELTIPFSLNQRHIDSPADMRKQMARVFQDAVWQIAELGEKRYSEQTFNELAGYIDKTSPDILQAAELDLTKSPIERLKKFSKEPENSYVLALISLKYFASQSSKLESIFILIDDLESKSTDLQKSAVTNAMEAKECILNTSKQGQKIPVHLLVSVRPETYAWMRALEEVKTTVFRPIAFSAPVAIEDIFQARFLAVFERNDYAHLQDQSRLDNALNVLNKICDLLSANKPGRFIKLHNYNLRRSLESFRMICCNRRWLQRDADYSSYFSIDEYQFHVSQPTVLRALGMGEFDIYPQHSTCLSNLLWNTREPLSDLLLIYVVRFLLQRSDHSERRDALVAKFSKFLGAQFDQSVFEEILSYATGSAELIHQERSNGDAVLSLTPRSEVLYEMLGESTILLEMYRDDIAVNTTSGLKLDSTRSIKSVELIFSEIFKLIKFLYEVERKLRASFNSNGLTNNGEEQFGARSEFFRLRRSFSTSVRAFYSNAQDGIPQALQANLDSLKKLEN